MNTPQPYDPRRALAAHKAQERAAWDRFAAAAPIEPVTPIEGTPFDFTRATEDTAYRAGQYADALLADRRRRFHGPRIHVEEEGA